MSNEKLRKAIASLPCSYCGIEGRSQVAHSNLSIHGKSFGLKATDFAEFPLCGDIPGGHGCHYKFDQYQLGLVDESVYELTYRLISETYIKLMNLGYLTVTFKG